ncbi:MAG TPA: DUF1844 domain-containing protein [Phycisphaerales bacterium]|jgi:hypothetical protein|nr:DUF1844 domain-containing protein [Phycisphaerales bacterium]
MADQPGESPKIIVDSDWKAQAQKEREKLAEKDRQAKQAAEKARQPAGVAGGAAGTTPSGSAAAGQAMQGLPPADFQTLVGTMVTQALMYMGAFPDPETGRAIVSLEHARFHIDLLTVLQEKTKNNLSDDESKDLNQALSELRLRFVDIVQAIAQMKKEGKLRPAGADIASPGMGGFSGPGMPGA